MDIPCSSHQPLVKCLLELISPKFILELGAGNYSTPIFQAVNFDKMISIENDTAWIQHVKSKFSKPNYEIRFHDLGPIGQFTFMRDLSQEQRLAIENYYQKLKIEINQQSIPKLLFVDQFTACRTISINILSPLFDVIIYHDTEPHGYSFYDYSNILVNDRFDHYQLQSSSNPWTDCFINKSLKIDSLKLKDEIQKQLKEYCSTYNLNINDWILNEI